MDGFLADSSKEIKKGLWKLEKLCMSKPLSWGNGRETIDMVKTFEDGGNLLILSGMPRAGGEIGSLG